MNTSMLDPPSRSPFRFKRAGDIKPRPMDWLVSGLFELDGLLLIVGDPSAGKSFWALDLAACIATGHEHHGRAVQAGPVHYIAGEGHNGISRRLRAWMIRNELELGDAPLYVSEVAAQIGDEVNTATVLEAINCTGDTPKLVVLDTLNRNMAGDENATKDMGAFIACCDEIRAAYGCTVALVHHTGHGNKSRARGSSVLHGAIDTTYHVEKDAAGNVTVTCTRMKDGPTPDPFAFRLTTVELGLANEDGTEATSAVLDPCGVPESRPKVSGKHQGTALNLLKRLEREHRDRLAEGGDPAMARVRRNDWRAACLESGIPANRFAEAEVALKQKGLIAQNGYYTRST